MLLNCKNDYIERAGVALFIAVLCEGLEFSETKIWNQTVLMREVLTYIQNNFKEDCSATKLAAQFGYSKEHLSRIFNKYVDKTIPEYINDLRMSFFEGNKAKSKNLNELIFESGFKSVQTYYRWKKRKL